MHAFELSQLNGIDALTLTERPAPRPGPGQVLVRVRAASLNYRDLVIVRGQYPWPVRTPLVPLSDAAGEVIAVGEGVRRLAPGDRVVGAFFQRWIDGPIDAAKTASALGGAIDGVLAQEVVLEESATLELPDSLSFAEAATLPCAGVTAWHSLVELGRLTAGQTVLALGTGGTSLFALQIAHALGARVIVTSSSDDKLARARALGADAVINYRVTPDWAARALELTDGRGVDQILEVGGATTLPQSLRALRPGGHLTLVGFLGGVPADLAQARANDRGVRVDSVFVGHTRHLESLIDLVATTRLRPVVDRAFSFADARQAYRLLESGAHFGKVVITL
jgi:NADPH:quinone reductase-like Zn-dependent oxidoreductase